MSRFAIFALVALIVLVGCVVITPSAEAVPSCVNAGNVTALGSIGCDLGPLNFSNFVVSPTGVAANIFLGGLSQVLGASTELTFQISHSPSPASLADILFFYTVKTLNGQPTIGGVDLFNPGSNVAIREVTCADPFVNGVCTSGLLSDYVAVSNSMKSATFTPTVSTLFVRKDIMLGPDSFISEFTNSHEDVPTATPEPATLLLLGSSLTALGMAARRRIRKTPIAAA
jgi:hypothetical protein